MRQKGGKATITIGIITLIALVYILFSTIYNQIIAQNEGFFYMIVFGGILVLVFVLLSLITKLIAISPQSTGSIVFTILEVCMMFAMGFFFLYKRFQFVSSLSVEDSLFYRAATFINDNTLSGSLDVVTKSLQNPTDYAYAVLLSIVFKFTSPVPEAVIYVNASVILMTAIFAAHIARALGGRVCAFIAFASTLIIPSQAYAVYSYNSVILFTLVVFICLDLYIHIYMAEEMSTLKRVLLDGLLAFFAAVMLITEPVSIILMVLIIVHYLIFSRDNLKAFFITLGGFLLVFFIFIILKGYSLGVSMPEVLSYSVSRFDFTENEETGESYEFSDVYESFEENINNQNRNITENYYFLTKVDGSTISAIQSSWLQLASSLLYMFSLILSISCVIFLFRSKNNKAVPIMLMSIGMLFTVFFRVQTGSSGFFVFEILLVFGCAGISYMYENQHPEAFVEEDIWSVEKEEEEEEEEELSEEEKEELLRRARALIFIGEDDELYEQIKEEEEEERERLKASAGKGAKKEEKSKAVKKEEKEEEQDEEETAEEEQEAEEEEEEETSGSAYVRPGKPKTTPREQEEKPRPSSKYDDDDGFGDYEDEAQEEEDAEAQEDEAYDDAYEEEDYEERPLSRKELRALRKAERAEAKRLKKARKKGILLEDEEGDYYEEPEYGEEPLDIEDIEDDEALEDIEDALDLEAEDEDEPYERPHRRPSSGEPLESPLPLPKKHESKSLDFDDEDFEDEAYSDDEEQDEDFEDEDYDDSWD